MPDKNAGDKIEKALPGPQVARPQQMPAPPNVGPVTRPPQPTGQPAPRGRGTPAPKK